MPDRVVITGLGIVSPLGLDARAHYEAACDGRSGIRPIEHFDVTGLRTRFAGQVDGAGFAAALVDVDPSKMDRFAHLAVVASRAGLADARLRPGEDGVLSERVAVCIGTAQGGRIADEQAMERYFSGGGKFMRAAGVPLIMPSAATAWVGILCNARGPAFPLSTACAAGLQSVALGASLIQSGAADVVIAGAADAPIVRTMILAWCTARATSARNGDPRSASRPFDLGRDGFVLAEGAAALILESAEHAVGRGAQIYAEIRGQGHSSDGFDMVAPSPSGEGAARAMRAALKNAKAEPDQITIASAHGTSTRMNDAAEATALREVFGEKPGPAIMSLKSLTGHAMGASGAIEVATLAMVLKEGVIPPNPNLVEVDPACRLNHVAGSAGRYQGGLAIASSLAFGGANSSLVLAPWPTHGAS
ncbi:MAG: beta-ketoacyl-[acyl-carrier-protein] synthase family protein [Vicinamibacteria bacterium]|nr:beta-ketoacyl-[acyl-carrier-protein] synthase family protein [Vicinamibacteria bacterium]